MQTKNAKGFVAKIPLGFSVITTTTIITSATILLPLYNA